MNAEQNKARKTGIIGGTFDPPHNAHLAIAEAARIQYGLDRVLMMPSGHSYFKDHQKRQVTPAPIRLKMTGAYRARTCDPLLVRQVLSQLS